MSTEPGNKPNPSPSGPTGNTAGSPSGTTGSPSRTAGSQAGAFQSAGAGAANTGTNVSRDQVVEDLRRTVRDARSYLEQLTDQGKTRARDKAYETQDTMTDWVDQGEDMIRRNPIASVAIAAAIGWLIGKLGD